MRHSHMIFAAAIFALASPLAKAKPLLPKNPWPELGVETRMYIGGGFISERGGNSDIRTFEPDGNKGLWLQDRQRRWYYAEILGACPDLNFAQAIGLDNRRSDYLDKFTRIYVSGYPCAFSSFVTSAEPPSKKERKALEKERRAAKKAKKAAQAVR